MPLHQFSHIYEAYYSTIYRYLFYLIRHETTAEDLTQETFVRFINATLDFKDDAHRLAWLRKTARHLAYDHLRRQKIIKWLPLLTQDEPTTTCSLTYLEKQQDAYHLYEALNELKTSEREVIILRKIEELSIKESAQLLGWSESKVKNTQARALVTLRKILGGEAFE